MIVSIAPIEFVHTNFEAEPELECRLVQDHEDVNLEVRIKDSGQEWALAFWLYANSVSDKIEGRKSFISPGLRAVLATTDDGDLLVE